MRLTVPRVLAGAVGVLAVVVAMGAGVPGTLEARIVYPPDNALLGGDGRIEVLAFRPAAAGPGTIEVVQEAGSKNYPAGQGAVRVKVTVLAGRNVLRLDGETVNVFLEGAGAGKPPAGFEVPDAHAEGIACEDCHSIGKEGTSLLEPEGKLCLRCHDDVTAVEGQRLVPHPPAKDGDCGACHRLHGAAITRLSAPGRRALCLGCHQDKNRNPAGATWATPHAPVARGMCTSCHGPHGTPYTSLLTRPGNLVCHGCHKEPHRFHRSVADATRLKNAGIPEGFPVSRTGELGCGGCHLPHGSDNKRLWTHNEKVLCVQCHENL